MDSEDGDCNTEFSISLIKSEAYLRNLARGRRSAFLCLKKVLI